MTRAPFALADGARSSGKFKMRGVCKICGAEFKSNTVHVMRVMFKSHLRAMHSISLEPLPLGSNLIIKGEQS